MVSGVSRIFFGSKNWNLGWFHETRQKNKLKLLGHPAGPEGRREERSDERRPEGPAGCPRSFNFFLSGFMNTNQGFQFFAPKKYPWIPLKSSKKSMKSRSQNKKNMRGLPWNLALVIFWSRIQLLYSYNTKLYDENINVIISRSHRCLFFQYKSTSGSFPQANNTSVVIEFKSQEISPSGSFLQRSEQINIWKPGTD